MNKNQTTKHQIFEKNNANAVGAHDCARQKTLNKSIANTVGVAASHACDICNSHSSNSYPNSDPHSRGITLIALIITIIVMLILVGVSIAMAINGNLFGITKNGAKQTTIEVYREHIEAVRINAKAEQIKQNLDSAGFLDKVKEGLEEERAKEGNVFEGSTITRPKTSVKITTKEGYLFKITESKILYMGLASEQGELTINLNNENTFFISNPEEGIWTNKKEVPVVEVEIETRVDAEELGAILEYSFDEENWQEYTGAIPVENNGQKVFARLYSEEEDEEGTHAEYTVNNIDRLDPKQFIPTGTAEGYYSIKLEGSTEDAAATATDGSSGIKAYYYSKDNGVTWEPQNGTLDTSYTFEKLKDNTTYTGFKMKAVDNAGNEIITEKEITVTLPEAPVPHVGDYVNYQPDTVTTAYTLYGKYSGHGVTSSKPTGTDQEITQDTLKWQILKIYDDGSMDLIGSLTSKGINFKGALGYNNGVYFMNDICNTFYSKTIERNGKSERIEARSVNLEDFEDEDLIEDGAKWKEVRDAYTNSGVQYGATKTYTGTKSYYPNLYARENGAGINTETIKTDGIGVSDKYYTTPTDETYSPTETPTAENTLTVTQTDYKVKLIEENYGPVYKVLSKPNFWIASRSVSCGSSECSFSLWVVENRGSSPFYVYGTRMFTSSGSTSTSYVSGIKLRPVVHLGSSAQLELNDKATDSRYPHKIINY